MKTQEEIEKLARIYENYNPNDSEIAQAESGGCYHGYKNGYTQCQEDMADESIKFAEWINKNDYEKIHGDRWCKKFMSYTHSTSEMYKIYINSLNKQD